MGNNPVVVYILSSRSWKPGVISQHLQYNVIFLKHNMSLPLLGASDKYDRVIKHTGETSAAKKDTHKVAISEGKNPVGTRDTPDPSKWRRSKHIPWYAARVRNKTPCNHVHFIEELPKINVF